MLCCADPIASDSAMQGIYAMLSGLLLLSNGHRISCISWYFQLHVYSFALSEPVLHCTSLLLLLVSSHPPCSTNCFLPLPLVQLHQSHPQLAGLSAGSLPQVQHPHDCCEKGCSAGLNFSECQQHSPCLIMEVLLVIVLHFY